MAKYKFGHGIPTYNGIPMIGGVPPIAGTYYHVNPRIGGNGNTGDDSAKPVADFQTGEDRLTTAVGDGMIVWSQGNSGSDTTSYLTEAVAFDKSGCTVIGVHAGQSYKGRARISASSTYDLAYMMDVSGSNNSFYNLHFSNGGDANTALGCVRVTGGRNYFYNCHFVGAGHATPAAVAHAAGSSYGAHDLMLSSSENTFERCTFGDVSIVHAAANANLVLAGQMSKNEFIDCTFTKYSATAGTGAIAIYAINVLNGWIVFDNCKFLNWNVNAATAHTSLMIGAAPTNPGLLFKDCGMIGWALWDSATGNDIAYITNGAGHATGGLGIVAS